MDIVKLQSEIIEVLILLQSLNGINLSLLTKLFQSSFVEQIENFGKLEGIIKSMTPVEFEALLHSSVVTENNSSYKAALPPSISENDLETFSLAYKVQQLQDMLVRRLSVNHLMKLFEIVPIPNPLTLSGYAASLSSEIHQIQLLEQLQQVFSTVLCESLISAKEQILFSSAEEEQERLSELLSLSWEQFHLVKPLRLLLQMDVDEIKMFYDALPHLQPSQLLLLVSLLQSDPFTVLEYRRVLTPTTTVQQQQPPPQPYNRQEDVSFTVSTIKNEPIDNSLNQNACPVSIQIIEQPPERSVYKRNLKPNPAVKLVGDETQVEGPLLIAPVLVKCDTQQDMPKLTGNTPIKTTVDRLITFKKLKVTVTSHQENGALFCLRFEARRYINQNDYEVITSVQSNPMTVLSHSTQLKPPTAQPPIIQEMIPASGFMTGGTKVVFIGSNFVDSPAAKVKFGDVEVAPSFYSTGTLLCQIPPHPTGEVMVQVSNDGVTWSDQLLRFTFQEDATIHKSIDKPECMIEKKAEVSTGFFFPLEMEPIELNYFKASTTATM